MVANRREMVRLFPCVTLPTITRDKLNFLFLSEDPDKHLAVCCLARNKSINDALSHNVFGPTFTRTRGV